MVPLPNLKNGVASNTGGNKHHTVVIRIEVVTRCFLYSLYFSGAPIFFVRSTHVFVCIKFEPVLIVNIVSSYLFQAAADFVDTGIVTDQVAVFVASQRASDNSRHCDMI